MDADGRGRLVIKSGDKIIFDKKIAPGEIAVVNLRPGEKLDSVEQVPREQLSI